MSNHLRTPMITVELLLWPSPPKDAHPYWWGAGRLDFHAADGPGEARRTVWEGDLSYVCSLAEHTARVRYQDSFGWLLVLTFTHERAKRILGDLTLPNLIRPENVEMLAVRT